MFRDSSELITISLKINSFSLRDFKSLIILLKEIDKLPISSSPKISALASRFPSETHRAVFSRVFNETSRT